MEHALRAIRLALLKGRTRAYVPYEPEFEDLMRRVLAHLTRDGIEASFKPVRVPCDCCGITLTPRLCIHMPVRMHPILRNVVAPIELQSLHQADEEIAVARGMRNRPVEYFIGLV